MDQDKTDRGEHAPEIDARMAQLLARRHTRAQRAAGSEPAELEQVARLLDGDLPPAEARALEERISRDPELGEVVARLRDLEGDNKVVPLARAKERRMAPQVARRMTLAIGGLVALAAVAFLVVRGSPKTELAGQAGAGVGGQALALDFRWIDGLPCTAEIHLPHGVQASLAAVGPNGAVDLGTFGDTARVSLPGCEAKPCTYIIASSPPAPASSFAGVVSAECVVKPLATGARTGIVRVP